MALYPKAVKKLIPPGSNDPKITASQIILHTAVSGADSLFDFFAHHSGGIESHFYIRNDGTVEQYRDTAYQADANYYANDKALSIETEDNGNPNLPWTSAQVTALTALVLWLCREHSIPARKCALWTSSGIGFHSQFKPWSPVAKTCPGPKRKLQIPGIIADVKQGLTLKVAAPVAPKYPGKAAFNGSPNPAVTRLGKRLVKLGYGGSYHVGPGPRFGRADARAVKAFKKDQGWRPGSGKPGRRAWRRLFRKVNK